MLRQCNHLTALASFRNSNRRLETTNKEAFLDKTNLGRSSRTTERAESQAVTRYREIAAGATVQAASSLEAPDQRQTDTSSIQEGAPDPLMRHQMEPTELVGSDLCTSSGHGILHSVNDAFSLRKQKDLAAGSVLQLSTSNCSSRFDIGLGKLQCRRFMACSRIKLWWMTPEWGTSASDVPPETQFLLLELGSQGPYAVILPLIDQNKFRATLRPPRQGHDSKDLLRLVVESNNTAVQSKHFPSTVLVAAGYNPYHLVDQAVAAAARISGTSKARVDKVAPDILNYFGWCTWDAFYSTISAEGIQQGLQAFKEGGVQPKFLIIDDGWQTTAADKRSEESAAEKQAKKDLLEKSGAGGNYITNTFQAEEEGAAQQAAAKPSSLQQVLGRGQALLQSSLFALYKRYVELAAPDSWAIAFFATLAGGPLKPLLRDYYDLTSDHTQRLQSVKANGKFSSIQATSRTPMSRPEDLKSIVKHCKEEFGVNLVYAWHSLHGYWAGVSAESPEMPYAVKIVTPTPSPGVLEVDPCFVWSQFVTAGVGVPADMSKVYKDMHSYLKGAGIDGVKVDCQAVMGMVGGGAPDLGGGPAISAQYHAALEKSVSSFFPGNNCINCMCHSTEDFYRMENTVIARSSDDFWPRDYASHTTHVAVNAYNSLFMGVLIQPDWDMFHSQHPAGLLHATARVISGGPVYVSDKPGQHDFNLLRRLVLKDGSLLRCTDVGRPTLDTLFVDPMRDGTSLLKVWNTNPAGAVLAAFNLQGSSWSRTLRKYHTHDEAPQTLQTTIGPYDIPLYKELPSSTKFVVYSDHQNHKWTLERDQSIPLSLGPGSSDIFSITPVQTKGKLAFAAIGLINMLNTNGAIQDVEFSNKAQGGMIVEVRVKGEGEFLAHSSQAPSKCSVNGKIVDPLYNESSNTFSCLLDQLDNRIVLEF